MFSHLLPSHRRCHLVLQGYACDFFSQHIQCVAKVPLADAGQWNGIFKKSLLNIKLFVNEEALIKIFSPFHIYRCKLNTLSFSNNAVHWGTGSLMMQCWMSHQGFFCGSKSNLSLSLQLFLYIHGAMHAFVAVAI